MSQNTLFNIKIKKSFFCCTNVPMWINMHIAKSMTEFKRTCSKRNIKVFFRWMQTWSIQNRKMLMMLMWRYDSYYSLNALWYSSFILFVSFKTQLSFSVFCPIVRIDCVWVFLLVVQICRLNDNWSLLLILWSMTLPQKYIFLNLLKASLNICIWKF